MNGRLLPAVLALSLLLGCAPRPSEADGGPPAEQVLSAVLLSQRGGEALRTLDEEEAGLYLAGLYGLDPEELTGAAIAAAGGVDAREIAVLRRGSAASAQQVEAALEARRQDRASDFFGYAPGEAALASRGRTVTVGDWTALLICPDPDRAAQALEAYVTRGELPPSPTPGRATATPAPSATPAPTPEPAAVPAPEPTAEPTPRPAAATERPAPRLHGAEAVLAAWGTGDAAALDGKDAALYERCREIFTQTVVPGMSDYEKELALHDWIIVNCAYDEAALDPLGHTAEGDNATPYGALVEGKAICLGYAGAFQLLMDLAGVECRTVRGTAGEEREDHAWNMVRLDGEWYCVDVTWDDPVGSMAVTWAQHHSYFNVTSWLMERTGHDWDREETPEATAVRYCWQG